MFAKQIPHPLGVGSFIMRLKISRKEAKETMHWLELIEEANPELADKMEKIKQEAKELKNILSAIIAKTEKNE